MSLHNTWVTERTITVYDVMCPECGAEYTSKWYNEAEQQAEECCLGTESDQDLVTDGGLPDDSSMRCFDCERAFDRRHISLTEVPVPDEDGLGYEFVPVPLCEECRLRRYGIKCQHCDGYHWDHEAVFECGRDRPSLVPDGGHLPSDIRCRPHTVDPETGDPHPLRPDGGTVDDHWLEDADYDYDLDAPGVPRGEGGSFGDLAARIRGEYAGDDTMDRTTLRLPTGMLARLDSYVEVGRYPNRSAAVRAGIRRLIDDEPAWFERYRRDDP